ncbi:phenylacetate--CoA ligase [Defluviitalea saccharophila]|uniref:Phenylacetate--CoA ligase n=1 Tax=Defluviitalea saccharophila TaxID=879970 RepID=A0ABZ2Y422_9FIRM
MSYKKYWNEAIEAMPREEIETYQTEQLKRHLQFAYENSPYYKQSFDEAGVSPEDFKVLSDLSKFPFINKQIERDAQLSKPLLGTLAATSEEDVVFVSASSGSTGVPTLSPFTKVDFDEFQDVQSRLFWAAGVRPNDRYVHALNFTLFVGGPDVIGAQNLGALCIWAGTIPSERLLYILKEFQPTVIWTTPSYAWYLGETAKKQGINPATDLAIHKIIVAGEPGGSIEATRKAIEELWDAEVYDFYGISDIYGACAGMCSERNGLHIAEDQIYVEVIDPVTLEPVKDGERGELVLTTLRKQARPMIRFRTGDIAIVNREKCGCGRTHGRIQIVGRLDDMLIVSGVNIFPSDIEFIVRNIKELTGEYRVYALSENFTTKFKVEVEKLADASISNEALAEKVSQSIKARLGVKPKEVVILEEGTLPRATHKAKRFVDLR